jgi:hypothetical protein
LSEADSLQQWKYGIPEDRYYKLTGAKDAHVAPTHAIDNNTLSPAPLIFTYLDCGRWGGDPPKAQRNFGVVWGRWAMLCDFVPSGGAVSAATKKGDTPLDAVIEALSGSRSSVKVMNKIWSASHVEPTWDHAHVFLPDLHLPIVRNYPRYQDYLGGPDGGGRDYESDGPTMGRYEYVGEDSRAADGTNAYTGKLGPSALQWFRQYLRGDIFQNAGDDLVLFLKLLKNYKHTVPMHFIQLGDMYDLWIGLDRFFDGDGNGQVVLSKSNGNDAAARNFVSYWVDRTNKNFPELLETLGGLKGECIRSTSWLYGNHDNYLSECTPPGGSARLQYIRSSGLFVEHGHRGDPQNADGARMGYWVTNQVFQYPFLRELDPDRRQKFVDTAAESFAKRPDFCVYVMGHTHSPCIGEVTLAGVATPSAEDVSPQVAAGW